MKWQPYQFNCPQCGRTFNSHRKDAKYCSRTCSAKSRKQPPIIKKCDWCGDEFDARAKNHNRELKRMLSQKFCSRRCTAQERATYYNQENHHGWKGGVFEDSGYKRVNIYLGHGKRRTPGQHRVIIEKEAGRKLDYNEVVHHKDRNRSNNELENLELMTRAGHSKHHYQLGHYSIGSYKNAS